MNKCKGTQDQWAVSLHGMWRSMIISFGFQALAIIAAVIISIFTVDKLGAISLQQPMPPLPRPPKAVKIIASAHQVSSSPASAPVARLLVAPVNIPVGVPVIADVPEMAMAQVHAIGVASGIDEGIPGALNALGSPSPDLTAAPPPRPKPVPPQVAQPIKVGGNVLEAKLVTRVMPIYPALARQARISGTVRLEGIIAKDGKVVNLQVISGHPLLINAAVEAVRQWVYRPTLLNGQAVEVIAPIDVHFTLVQ
jgi:periplasmic protein TonB